MDSSSDKASVELSSDDVLRAEVKAIHHKELPKLGSRELYCALNELRSAALCLSGGGIRSAAFALGVLQAFAAHPRPDHVADPGKPVENAANCLLGKFHYISTVSGGGYIGSWLAAWRINEAFANIWPNLVNRLEGPDNEPRPIAWLRSFSNYLTPKIGITSADTWSGAAQWARNLLLNWIVIIPPICVIVLVQKLFGLASTWTILWVEPNHWTPAWDGTEWSFYVKLVLECAGGIAGAFCLGKALVAATRSRSAFRLKRDYGPDQYQFLKTTLLWSVLSAVFLVHFLASDLAGNLLLTCTDGHSRTIWFLTFCDQHDILRHHADWSEPGWNIARYPKFFYAAAGGVVGATIYGGAYGVARRVPLRGFDPLAWAISGAFYGVLVALGFYLYLVIPDEGIGGLPVYFLHLVFGVPWILMSQLAADILFVGLSSYEEQSEADREWFGRAAGWVLAVALVWATVMFLVFFGTIATPLLGADVKREFTRYAPAAAAVSGFITAAFGKSSLSAVKGPAKGAWSRIMGIVLSPIALLFVAALLIVISYTLDQLLFDEALIPAEGGTLDNFDWAKRTVLLVLSLLVAFGVTLGASRAININRFSLHALYRNRLVRAFLGAARERRPDQFTGFDADDNPMMHDLWKHPSKDWRPFLIINISLNIVSSKRLSWQERKAEPFTVSLLHSGSSYVGYCESAKYGGRDGISLGTAMAISGAAASPNMGYHSSPAITFLMTLFNVRLGWWLANPGPHGKNAHAEDGPKWAIKPLVQEALGLTTDDREYVYLSDGGHFENLGLYEMVRRRCRYIVVCDSGCDPDFVFEDLANAVRKIEIDLGVRIRFTNLEGLRPRAKSGRDVGSGHPYHAMGEIDYRTADGAKHNGTILYIKAGYHGMESAGIRGYAKTKPDFPHQSTIDQWFTESQFESYRALGFEIADDLLNDALAHPACKADSTLERIFAALCELARRPSPLTSREHEPLGAEVAKDGPHENR